MSYYLQGDEDGAIAAYSEAINALQLLRNELVAINSDVQFFFREGVMAALHDGKQYLMEKYNVALTPGLELLESQPLTRGRKPSVAPNNSS